MAQRTVVTVRFDWITLLTDYGTYDGFVAACHGAAARIAPDVRIVDITHDVPPGDIRRGAVVLAQTAPFLPAAVHVGVVDPGVGTRRRGVALETRGGLFVGPDNGLLGWAADALGGVERAVNLTNPAYHQETVAQTFHGRDVFAPVAAHLALGLDLGEVGDGIDPGDLVRLAAPLRQVTGGKIACEVLTVDRFGNVQTTVTPEDLDAAGIAVGDQIEVTTAGETHPMRYSRAFADVPREHLLSYVDSAGLLAIAVNGGNAASRLRLLPGDALTINRWGAGPD